MTSETLELLFPALDGGFQTAFAELWRCVEKEIPVPPRFKERLPRDIAELSRLLTSARSERQGGYLSEPRFFSAYSRYFLPWNIYRLARLFLSPSISAHLEELFDTSQGLSREDLRVLDTGSGPLTIPLALWLSLPALRTKNIAIHAVDQNKYALKAGKKIFGAFTGERSSWQVSTHVSRLQGEHGGQGGAFAARGARLVSACFVLNEVFGRIPQADSEALRQSARGVAANLVRQTADGGAVLIVEPGVPRSAQYLAFLKEAFQEHDFFVRSPCPAGGGCPMRGGKRGSKWCHFVYDTEDAPPVLQALSARAGLAKERVTLSYLLFKKGAAPVPADNTVRVISDIFDLPQGMAGRYGCAKDGLVLVRSSRQRLGELPSGALISIKPDTNPEKDPKTGARLIRVSAATRPF